MLYNLLTIFTSAFIITVVYNIGKQSFTPQLSVNRIPMDEMNIVTEPDQKINRLPDMIDEKIESVDNRNIKIDREKFETKYDLNTSLFNYCPKTYNDNFNKILYKSPSKNQIPGYTKDIWLDNTRKLQDINIPIPVDINFINKNIKYK